MERTIKVTGKGKISVTPDTIRMFITQTNVEQTYEGAIRESAKRKEELNEALGTLGFKREDLKTLYFDIDTKYESYQTKNNNWKKRLVGYEYTHKIKIEFPKDNKMLGKVLGVISEIKGEPEFTIQYTISEPEKAKNELLAEAVIDSKEKAAVLAKAAGVNLGDIINIDYSWEEIDFYTRPIGNFMMRECPVEPDCENGSIDIDIEADDIDVADTVTVVWTVS